MASLVCGRCGNHPAPDSTYCSHCRWAVLIDSPRNNGGADLPDMGIAPKSGSFLEKRKQAGQRDTISRRYRDTLERQLNIVEKQLESDSENPQLWATMGVLSMLQNQWERANVFLEKALHWAPDDLTLNVNHAITLAHRGQLQPAMTALSALARKHPAVPFVWANLAFVALQARQPAIVHSAVESLEKLWLEDATISQEFYEKAFTARGVAFLQESKPNEAFTQFAAVALRAVQPEKTQGSRQESGADFTRDHNQTIDSQSLDKILEGKAIDAETLANIALAEADTGGVDKAVTRLKRALQMEPGHPRILANMGVLAYRQGRLHAARRYLELAQYIETETDRPDATTWNHLGVVVSALGDVNTAFDCFQRAGGREHCEVEVFYNFGRAFVEFGKADMGVSSLREAFKIEPNNADIHTVLGAAYLYAGKVGLYPDALKYLKRALQIDPYNRYAAINLVLALMESKNNESAQKLLDQVMKLFPDYAEPHYLAALLQLERIQPAQSSEELWIKAMREFETARTIRSDLVSATYNLALCQFVMGFRDRAANLLQEVINRDASIGPAYYLIGYGHALGKRDNEALAAWKIAAQYEGNNVDFYVNLAFCLYRLGDFAGATRAYMQAHELAPTDATILAAMGVTFARQQLYQQSIDSLNKAIDLNSRSAVTHSNLGLAYFLFKKVEKAVDHWRLVSKLDSNYAKSREGEQERSFDDSVVQLRPIPWRERLIKLAPILPPPRTRLIPNNDLRDYHAVIDDASLRDIVVAKRQVERESRLLAWMSLK